MSEIAVRMEHVYKKFRKGEIYNSLRDLLPALTGKNVPAIRNSVNRTRVNSGPCRIFRSR